MVWICFGGVAFMADTVDISPFVDKQTVDEWPFLPQAMQKAVLAMHLLPLSQLFLPHPVQQRILLESVVGLTGSA